MFKRLLSQLDALIGWRNKWDSESFPPFWENECLPKLTFWIEESETWGGEELAFMGTYYVPGAFFGGSESTCSVRGLGLIPGLGRSPWRRQSDMTEQLSPTQHHVPDRTVARVVPFNSQKKPVRQVLLLSSPLYS